MDVRRAAVLGSPIEHSLSPVLHEAAFQALGLTGWTFERIQCEADELPALVDGLDGDWAGLAVTMPGKRAALAYATERTRVAELVGAANTLVPLDGGGWLADCTDVEGVTGAVRSAGDWAGGARAVVLGAGGTATAALAAFDALGIQEATIVARDAVRAAEAMDCAERIGIKSTMLCWADVDFRKLCGGADLVVSTVPPAATAVHADEIALARCVLDVIYHPWPTPLSQAVLSAGNKLVTGLDMLLHQAFVQVQWFTGQQAPRAAMRAALREATGDLLPLENTAGR